MERMFRNSFCREKRNTVMFDHHQCALLFFCPGATAAFRLANSSKKMSFSLMIKKERLLLDISCRAF